MGSAVYRVATQINGSPSAATSGTIDSEVVLQAALKQEEAYTLEAAWPEKNGSELWSAELASGGSVASVTLRIEGMQVD